MAAAAAGAAPVDCKECARQFPTFKVYIKHLLAKECGAAQDQAKAAVHQEYQANSPIRCSMGTLLSSANTSLPMGSTHGTMWQFYH